VVGSERRISVAFRLSLEPVGSPELVVKNPTLFGNLLLNLASALVSLIIAMLAIISMIAGIFIRARLEF
jgi:protein-S-isoprenylcysteine O-methyltransferase Ste14